MQVRGRLRDREISDRLQSVAWGNQMKMSRCYLLLLLFLVSSAKRTSVVRREECQKVRERLTKCVCSKGYVTSIATGETQGLPWCSLVKIGENWSILVKFGLFWLYSRSFPRWMSGEALYKASV